VAAPAELERPRYSYSESDRIAGVSRGTSKRWLKGYQYLGPDGRIVQRPPVSVGEEPVEPGVSFLELVEVAAIGRLKDAGFSLHQIRVIVDRCEEIFGAPRPLVTLRFRVDGRAAFVQADDSLVNLGLTRGKRQRAWEEVLSPFLVTIEYEDGIARRWWPRGQEHHVLVDPEIGFGYPVVEGTGIRTEIILEQFRAGRDPDEIAADFNLTSGQVLDAIRFETQLDGTTALQTA
jgi:uncharacterized protein (DUF433 family)